MTSFSLIKVINYSKFLICCLTVSTAYITPNKLLTSLFTITRYISISECSTYTIVVYSAILIHSDYFNLSFLSHSISIQTSNRSYYYISVYISLIIPCLILFTIKCNITINGST
nr:MAG TPA: hypothetical protein [Caudoviricetes sp.]